MTPRTLLWKWDNPTSDCAVIACPVDDDPNARNFVRGLAFATSMSLPLWTVIIFALRA
jgi:hypothetical protein